MIEPMKNDWYPIQNRVWPSKLHAVFLQVFVWNVVKERETNEKKPNQEPEVQDSKDDAAEADAEMV